MEKFKKEQFANLSYEEMMEKLEQIIAKMDHGNIPLEESLNSFDEGMLLIQVAREKLESYRGRIEKNIQEGQ